MTTAGQKGQWAATPQEFASAPARVGVRPPAVYIAETWQTGDAMDEISIGHLKDVADLKQCSGTNVQRSAEMVGEDMWAANRE